jgi:uncharacterized protein
MSSLSFPDLNVWLALATPEHVHHAAASRWWGQEKNHIAFMRFTQMGFLRLMTTASAMDGRPLTMAQAWRVYDRLFEDDRVAFIPEPAAAEARFRASTARTRASPKLWGDAWLLAFAESAHGILVTFDSALATRGNALLLS